MTLQPSRPTPSWVVTPAWCASCGAPVPPLVAEDCDAEYLCPTCAHLFEMDAAVLPTTAALQRFEPAGPIVDRTGDATSTRCASWLDASTGVTHPQFVFKPYSRQLERSLVPCRRQAHGDDAHEWDSPSRRMTH